MWQSCGIMLQNGQGWWPVWHSLLHSISQSLIAGARWPNRIMAFLRLWFDWRTPSILRDARLAFAEMKTSKPLLCKSASPIHRITPLKHSPLASSCKMWPKGIALSCQQRQLWFAVGESSGIRDPPSTKPNDPLLEPFDSMATTAVSCQTPLLKKDLCITLIVWWLRCSGEWWGWGPGILLLSGYLDGSGTSIAQRPKIV